jgi:hypothetical protein
MSGARQWCVDTKGTDQMKKLVAYLIISAAILAPMTANAGNGFNGMRVLTVTTPGCWEREQLGPFLEVVGATEAEEIWRKEEPTSECKLFKYGTTIVSIGHKREKKGVVYINYEEIQVLSLPAETFWIIP